LREATGQAGHRSTAGRLLSAPENRADRRSLRSHDDDRDAGHEIGQPREQPVEHREVTDQHARLVLTEPGRTTPGDHHHGAQPRPAP
jgi:hypothetical protein